MIRKPMSKVLSRRALWHLIGLFALIEVVFIADIFTSTLEKVLREGGSALDLGFLLILQTPQIVDFALPIVVLIALYFTVSAAREANELVAYAAAGVPWHQVPAFALRIGIAATLASILCAGFLTPISNYSTRMALHRMHANTVIAEITEAKPRSQLRMVRDRTIISTPPETPAAERGNLFVFDPGRGAGWRISQADDWTVEGPDAEGVYSVRLTSFRDYIQFPSANQQHLPSLSDARLNVNTLSMDFRLEQVVDSVDRARRESEQPIIMISKSGSAAVVNADLGRVLGRAIICLFAALLAIAAAGWSGTRAGHLTALPLAVVSVLGADVLARAYLGDAWESGLGGFGLRAAFAAAMAFAVPGAIILWRREALIAPAAGQA